jgi:excisionase family DNA binding protein
VKQNNVLMMGRERDQSDLLMTHGDVAKFAGVSQSAVRAWADSGKLRFIRTAGNIRLFDRTDVEKFLASRRSLTLGQLAR